MKRFLLLFVVLLPVIGMGQVVDLVRWDKANFSAANLVNGVTGSNILTSSTSGNQVHITANTTWEETHFFLTSGWPQPIYNGPGLSLNENRYIQLSISGESGKILKLSSLSFECRSQGNTLDYEVRYSKNADFGSAGTTLISKTNVGTSWSNTPPNSFSNLELLHNEKLYIRIYVYNANDNFHIKFSENKIGPTLKGTSSQVCTPQGDSTIFGTDKWLGYTYDLPNNFSYTANTFPTTSYKGYVTENNLNFDRDNGTSTSGGDTVNLCDAKSDNFAIRYRRNVKLDAGNYIFTVGGDDGYRLSIDGGSTWIINNWSAHSYTTTNSSTICIDGSDKKFILEYIENTGSSRVSFKYTKVADVTAPTSISGINNNCVAGDAITLTALGSNASEENFRWGTGNSGENVIAGQNNSSITVTPSVQTTY